MVQHVTMVRRHVESHMKDLEKSGNLREGFIHPAKDLKLSPFEIVAEIFSVKFPPCPVGCLKRLIPLREDLFKDVIRGGLSRFAFMRFLPTTRARSLQTLISSGNPSIHQSTITPGSPSPIVLINDAVKQGSIPQ